jgi:hypothetical protein
MLTLFNGARSDEGIAEGAPDGTADGTAGGVGNGFVGAGATATATVGTGGNSGSSGTSGTQSAVVSADALLPRPRREVGRMTALKVPCRLSAALLERSSNVENECDRKCPEAFLDCRPEWDGSTLGRRPNCDADMALENTLSAPTELFLLRVATGAGSRSGGGSTSLKGYIG